jgi:hypothetical protein
MKRIQIPLSFLAMLTLLSTACGVQQKSQTTEETAAAQIAPEEIELAGMRLGVDGTDAYHVMGQIQNNSPKLTLTEVNVKVSLQDCLETGTCEVLGEQVVAVPTDVPPTQSKEFETHLQFKDLPKAKGTLGWHYVVVATKSKAP